MFSPLVTNLLFGLGILVLACTAGAVFFYGGRALMRKRDSDQIIYRSRQADREAKQREAQLMRYSMTQFAGTKASDRTR